jgi:hypothetical protein
MEFIGCKAECVKSLGACSDNLPEIEKLLDTAFSASTFVDGNESHKGRVAYGSFGKEVKKLHKITVFGAESANTFDKANQKCVTVGDALVSIHSDDDQENIRYR